MIIMVVELMAAAEQLTGAVSGPTVLMCVNFYVDLYVYLRSGTVGPVIDGCPNSPQPNSLQATTMNWYSMAGRIFSVTL